MIRNEIDTGNSIETSYEYNPRQRWVTHGVDEISITGGILSVFGRCR
jgi:hypothetical protein